MVQQAMADAQAMRDDGRRQIEILVAEAEQLRAFARQGAESSAKQAREEVMKKAGEMIGERQPSPARRRGDGITSCSGGAGKI